MILADKIIELRKKNGWSQEQLAAELGVSRQAISKWESAQSIPDISRILEMSEIFAVSTDFLIKDEMEMSPSVPLDPGTSPIEASGVTKRQVSMEEAVAFLDAKTRSAQLIALGVALCILGVDILITFTTLSDLKMLPLSENVSAIIGVLSMLILITIAVVIFIFFGMQTKRFEYLEEEVFETAYGVTGMVKQRKEKFLPQFTWKVIVGVVLCLFTLMLIIVGSVLSGDADNTSSHTTLFLVAGLPLVAIAVYLFVSVGIPWGAMAQLLQEGDFTASNKAKNKIIEPVAGTFWVATTAVFLGYSLSTNNWEKSWIIWPVAALVFVVLVIIVEAWYERK